jgi:hypothetical protein
VGAFVTSLLLFLDLVADGTTVPVITSVPELLVVAFAGMHSVDCVSTEDVASGAEIAGDELVTAAVDVFESHGSVSVSSEEEYTGEVDAEPSPPSVAVVRTPAE